MSDIILVLNNIGYSQLNDAGSIWRTNPLYREYRSQNSLAIKKSTGQWFDHSERQGGSLAQLVQKTLSLPDLEATKAYLGDLPILVDIRESVELTDIKKFDKGLLVKLIKDNEYWNKRGISDQVLNAFGGGLAQNGRMKGRYTIPIFDSREDLIGFAGRILVKQPNVPPWKLLGGKKNWVFPQSSQSSIFNKKSVVLVESIGDLFSLLEIGVDNVIVLFGVCLGPEIIKNLLRNDVERISILLNNDEDKGFVGNLAAESIKEDLCSFFDESQVIIITPPRNDLNEMLMTNKQELIDFCQEMQLST